MVCFYIFRGHDHCYYHYFYVILPVFFLFYCILFFILYSVLTRESDPDLTVASWLPDF